MKKTTITELILLFMIPNKLQKSHVYILFILLTLVSQQLSAQWAMARSFGVDLKNEYILGTGLDAQNNAYLLGRYSNGDPQYDFDGQALIDLPTVFGSNHGLVWAKYDAANTLQFVKSYRCMKDSNEASQITEPRMAVSPNGEVVIAGTYRHSIEIEGQSLIATQTGFAESNMFVAKFDNAGALIWLKNIDTYGASCLDLGIDNNGDVILAGSFKQAIDFGNNMSHSGSSSRDWGYLSKLAGSDGSAIAFEVFDGGHPTNIAVNGNGAIALIGEFKKNQIDFSDGTSFSLQTPVTSSNLKLNYFIANFSSTLSPTWIKQVRGNAMGIADLCLQGGNIKAMLNNTHYLALGTDSIDGDAHLVVTIDFATGNVNSFSTCGNVLYGMATNGNGTFLSTARDGNNAFNFGSFNTAVSDEFILFGIDQLDTVQWYETVNLSFSGYLRTAVMSANSSSLLMGGEVYNPSTINFNANISITPSGGLYTDGWFARYNLGPGVSLAETKRPKFNLYPNPAKEFITINNLPADTENIHLEIRDINGRLCKTKSLGQGDRKISTAILKPGVYLLSLTINGTAPQCIRFLKD